MIALAVDVTSAEWRRVAEYIEARRAELIDEMDSLTATPEERFAAAVRRDELRLLLEAPADARRATQARLDGDVTRVPLY